MSDAEQLDRDLREYLEKEPNLRREDRLKYLKILFNRHFEIDKLDHVVNSNDLFHVISEAKSKFAKQNSQIFVSRKKLDNSELIHIAMIESFISYLSRNSLLKRLVKFDYTD